MKADVLMLVEDPGAAAYVSGLPAALSRRGLSVRVLAAGHAAPMLAAEGAAHVVVRDSAELLAQLDAAEPRVIAIGTAENQHAFAHGLVAEARRRGLASVGLVDGPANAAFRFRGASDEALGHAPDWVAVPDEATRRAFIALGMASASVVACGHPRRDALHALRESAPALRSAMEVRRRWSGGGGRPVLLFAAELSSGVDGRPYCRAADYTLAGTSGAAGRTEIVLEEVLAAARSLQPRPALVLRLHPKTKRELYADYLTSFDAVSESESSAEATLAADAVVGLTSVMLDEALVLGRPVVSVLPRAAEADWLVGARLGLIPVACERAAIAPALRRALAGEGAPRSEVERFLPNGSADNVARLIAEAARLRFAA